MELLSTPPQHPVLACAARVREALDEVAGADPMYMRTSEKADALVALARVEARISALRLRLVASGDDVAQEDGARSVGSWLAHATRVDAGPALADERLATALEDRWHRLREGLAAGDVNPPQARVIARALEELPADLDAELLVKAEAYLVAEAAHFPPKQLRVLGAKVLEVVAPDLADEHERLALERAEARARRLTSLTMRRRGDGTTSINIRVSDAAAGRLRTYLEAYAAPRRGHLDGPERLDPDTGQRIGYHQLLGHAFCSLLEAIPAAGLPRHGGSATQVVVTIDHETLQCQLGAAGLLSGETISVAEAMRLACTASILPMVLDGRGQPLFVGRAQRLFSQAQRTAMDVRDRGCRTHGCTIPATWCEAHHRTPWSRGGRTDLDDGLLLCPWHHHRAHDPAYRTDLMPNGDLRFRRRT